MVPSRDIVSVEHPCVIKNIDNGLRTLEGVPKVSLRPLESSC